VKRSAGAIWGSFIGVAIAQATGLAAELRHTTDPFPSTYGDPVVPLLQLPTNLRARRSTANLSMQPGSQVEIPRTNGAGCVRHL